QVHGITRGAAMKKRLADDASWLTRLTQDFDVRRYAFDSSLKSLTGFSELTLDGESSAMQTSLTALAQRFRGQPIAGILLLTDGNATDVADGNIDWKNMPPVYPVALGAE